MTSQAKPRGMYFEDFEIGMELVTPRRTITLTDIVNFASLSGDFNAPHCDHEFCKTQPYGEPIAHGPLVWAVAGGLSYASGINDGAAAVVLMSAEKAAELGLQPKLKWHTRGVAGVEPAVMGIGPVPAVRKALGKAGMELSDIDLIELNEAFASQALYCIRELGMDIDKTNVNGSGISLGHPVGATGAIMTVKLLDEIEQRDQSLGLVTMCVGGGQGVATIFERIG